jgi:hypothetical protein
MKNVLWFLLGAIIAWAATHHWYSLYVEPKAISSFGAYAFYYGCIQGKSKEECLIRRELFKKELDILIN